jgi:putative peptidoglycan lipid II flippase
MRKTVWSLFFGNFLSKMLGLIREVATAALFGTGSIAGAFRTSQSAVLIPINFLISDALNSAFVPQYKHFQAQSENKACNFFWTVYALFGVFSLLLTIALWTLAERWLGLLAPGLDAATMSKAILMTRIMALGVFFYISSAMLMFLAMAHDDALPMSVRPLVQNAGLIAGVLAAYLTESPETIAWGFTLSYAIYFGWATTRLVRSRLLNFPAAWDYPGTRIILRSFWQTLRPLLLLPVFSQGNIVTERAVASLIGLTAISALDYARFVSETLVLLISMPIAFAGLAHWSGLGAEAIRQRLDKVLLLMMAVSVPISAFLAVHAHTVVQVAYGRGAFDAESVRVTGDILLGTALGLWAQVIGYVLVKALNAQMRNRAVLWVMAAALLANTAINLGLHTRLGAVTLGLGSAAYGLVLLGGCLTALGLWRRLLPAAATMALGCAGYVLLSHWLPTTDNMWRQLALACTTALLYWGLWVALVPSLRKALLEQVPARWRSTS